MQDTWDRSPVSQAVLTLPRIPREAEEGRIVKEFDPGGSTAFPSNVTYRIGKLSHLGILNGVWLDCGCADGGYTTALRAAGASMAFGVDTVEDRSIQAQERIAPSGVEFLHTSSDELPFPDESFDGVFLTEVMEHVSDEVTVLQEVLRVLRPGGSLAIMSPNRWVLFEGHGMQIGQSMILKPIPFLPWVPEQIGQRFMRARNYWPHELAGIVSRQGFSVTKVDFVLPSSSGIAGFPAQSSISIANSSRSSRRCRWSASCSACRCSSSRRNRRPEIAGRAYAVNRCASCIP